VDAFGWLEIPATRGAGLAVLISVTTEELQMLTGRYLDF
jgi:hypothetical protein